MTDTAHDAVYGKQAYRSTAIPEQPPHPSQTGFAKAIEGGDFIERLPWGHYAHLDISLQPDSLRRWQERWRGEGPANLAGPPWDEQRSPTDLFKLRWQPILNFYAVLAEFGMFMVLFVIFVLGIIVFTISDGMSGFIDGVKLTAGLVALHLFFRYPFEWFLTRYPQVLIHNLKTGFYRRTGMARIRLWGKNTFEAPFIEFDPYIAFTVSPKGPVTVKLVLRHRYVGHQTVVAQVPEVRKHELYAHWDELQRYMDVTQPLPDVPPLERYRHKDPTTAAHDAAGKRGRPADYWATLDPEWWEKEGYPAQMQAIRDYPWQSLEDRMTQSVPNLREAALA